MYNFAGFRLNKDTAAIAALGIGIGLFMPRRSNTTLSPQGALMLKAWEGFRAKPYQDIAGNWTVGYGTMISAGEASKYANGISKAEAERKMMEHVERDAAILNLDAYKFPQHVNDAILSLAYNVGAHSVLKSRAWDYLTIKDYDNAHFEWDWYYYTDPETGEKKVSEGLKNRRRAEQLVLGGMNYSGPDGFIATNPYV